MSHTTLLQIESEQRKTAKRLLPKFQSKGWRRDVPNNEFIKGDKAAYFSGEYLIFHFTGIQFSGLYCNSYHRVKLSSPD